MAMSRLFVHAVLAAGVLMASSAFAQGPGHEGKGPCASDVQKFCANVKQGGGRIVECLKEHQTELSPACSAKMAEAKEKTHEKAQACKADAEKFCQGIQPGGGKIMACLRSHQAELSPGCQASLANPKGSPQK